MTDSLRRAITAPRLSAIHSEMEMDDLVAMRLRLGGLARPKQETGKLPDARGPAPEPRENQTPLVVTAFGRVGGTQAYLSLKTATDVLDVILRVKCAGLKSTQTFFPSALLL